MIRDKRGKQGGGSVLKQPANMNESPKAKILRSIRLSKQKCSQVMQLAQSKRGVLLMCRDDGIKTLEAFSGDLSVLLSQLEAIQTRMKADINAQIGAQLTYLDSVISRAQMNSLKLEGLSTNLMEESPLTTVVNNYSSLAKELAAQDDLSQLKRLKMELPVTEEISNFATSAQSMLVSLANIVADLVRTSMSSDHSDGPFFHDSVLPQAVAPWQSSTHGHQEPLIEVEAFASQPLTSASMSGVTIAEPNISGAHSSLDRLSANNVVTSGMAPTDFFGPMRKPKPLRSALAAPPQIATYQSLNTGQISLDGSVDEEVQQPIGVERSAPPVLSFYEKSQETVEPPSAFNGSISPNSRPRQNSNSVSATQSHHGSFLTRDTKLNLVHMINNGRVRGIRTQLILELGEKNRKEPLDEAFMFPIGCTKNPVNRDYIVCDTGHNVVKVFDPEGIPKKLCYSAAQRGFKRPSAVVCCPELSSFIVKDDCSLQQFSFDGSVINEFGRGELRRPYGIARDMSGLVYTIDAVSPNEHYLCCYDPRNIFAAMTRLPYNCVPPDKQAQTKVRFLDICGNRLVVADLGASVVYISDLTGNKLGQFGRYGKLPGEMNEPSGISLDQVGNILVGDSRNDRVQLYTPAGEYICPVTMPVEIRRPSNICLTSDGELLVMNYIQHYVSVLKLLAPDE